MLFFEVSKDTVAKVEKDLADPESTVFPADSVPASSVKNNMKDPNTARRFPRMKKGTMHVSVSGLRIPIFALSAFSLVYRAGLQGKPALCAQRGDANDHGLVVCSLAVAMMFHMGRSCTTRVSMSPMSFVPVAVPVDDQQRCQRTMVWVRIF